MIKKIIKNILEKRGYGIHKFPYGNDGIKINLIKSKKIDLVLDVGANIGQYSSNLRKIGYNKKIISFEPLHNEFKILKEKAKDDGQWEVWNIALGDSNGTSEINIAGNSYSSSILNMKSAHYESAPHSKFIGSQKITVKALDTFLSENPSITSTNIFLKLDVQGFEKKVLIGAQKSLDKVKGMQLELSLEELYEGETLFNDMIEYLASMGYYVSFIESGFINPNNGKLLQVDVIFLS